MTPLPLSPFIDPSQPIALPAQRDFVLNETLFMHCFDPAPEPELPAFIADPRPEYLTAVELMPIVRTIAR